MRSPRVHTNDRIKPGKLLTTTNLWSVENMCTSIEHPTQALLRGGKIFHDSFLRAAASQGLRAGSYSKRQHALGKAAPQC